MHIQDCSAKSFRKITLKITIETEEELLMFYHKLNQELSELYYSNIKTCRDRKAIKPLFDYLHTIVNKLDLVKTKHDGKE